MIMLSDCTVISQSIIKCRAGWVPDGGNAQQDIDQVISDAKNLSYTYKGKDKNVNPELAKEIMSELINHSTENSIDRISKIIQMQCFRHETN